MSYLNDILASIGGDSPSSQSQPKPPQVLPPVQKRKAEDGLTSAVAKRSASSPNLQNGLTERPEAQTVLGNGGVPKSRPPNNAGGNEQKSATRPLAKPAQKLIPKPLSSLPSATTSKNSVKHVTTPTVSSPVTGEKSAPKVGSYAAILARAKATQGSKSSVGVIMHKQTEKVKKERAAELSKTKTLPGRDKNLSDRSRTGSAEISVKTADRDKRRPADESHTKKTKPSMPEYKGTAGLKSKSTEKQRVNRHDGYANWSDLDDVEDDEDDYDSEGSSDMEAGAFDIENEEQLSLRAAKKADADELAAEMAHKAAKLDRKAALQKLLDAKTKKRTAY